MSGFGAIPPMPPTPPYVTQETFHEGSFLVGLAIGRIWNEYKKASLINNRKANLSLGDFLWRLSQGWQKARSNENELRTAIETRFVLINLKSTRAKFAVIEMEEEYDRLLRGLQRFMKRDNLPPGNKKRALFQEAVKVFPKVKESDAVQWHDEGMTSAEIARTVVGLKYGIKPSTLKRLLSRVKRLTAEERSRRAWLQSYNKDSEPMLFKDVQTLSRFVRQYFLTTVLAIRGISAKPSVENQNLSSLSSLLLASGNSFLSFTQKK
jgi:hypothetical protein